MLRLPLQSELAAIADADPLPEVPGRSPVNADVAASVVLVGLAFEARIAAGPQALVICRQSEAEVAETIRTVVRQGCRRIASFGVAAGLHPALRPGDCIVASEIVDSNQTYVADASWSRRVLELLPGCKLGRIAGVDSIIEEPIAKADLHQITGALAADMESHIVARVASESKVAFAAIRVVLDPAHRRIPQAAVLAANKDGRVKIRPIIRSLVGRPRQLSVMLRLAGDAYAARRTLVRLRAAMGSEFGFAKAADLGSIEQMAAGASATATALIADLPAR